MAAHLIPVFTGETTQENTQLCNARDLHQSLQVGRDFSNWIKGRIEEYKFVEYEDFWVIDSPIPANHRSPDLASNRSPNSGSKKRGGQNKIDYHLTLDMAKELAMLENNEIGRQVRRYFIRAETELRTRVLADLTEKAEHVLPVKGVTLMRDELRLRDAIRLQEQGQKIVRLMFQSSSKVERQNLYYHLRQVNLTLGIPTLPLEDIEEEIEVANAKRLEGGE